MDLKTDNLIIESNSVNKDDSEIDTQFTSILDTLSIFKSQINLITSQLKTLEKVVKKEVKQHKKIASKKESRGNKKPSGFAEASPISNDLCDFMGKNHGTQCARTEVTKFICKYIKENTLTNDENKRVIQPDDKLKNLLGTDDDTVITYFTIQRHMNKHFIKKNNNTNSNNNVSNV